MNDAKEKSISQRKNYSNVNRKKKSINQNNYVVFAIEHKRQHDKRHNKNKIFISISKKQV